MPEYRVRQSKPLAVIGAVFGVVILVTGAVLIGTRTWAIWIWLAFGVGIIGYNLWSAFRRHGHDRAAASDGEASIATPGLVSYRVRPSKGLAWLVAVGGTVILVVGVVATLRGGAPLWFTAVFTAAGVFVVGAALWSGFAKNGRMHTIETTSEEPPPVRRGQIATRD